MRNVPAHGGGFFCIHHPCSKWEIGIGRAVLMYSEERESSIILEWPIEMGHAIIATTTNIGQRDGKYLYLLSKTIIMHRSIRFTNE